ncbi:DUF2341 domain-containing protein, partial [candidate division WOR-3 bacterium]|nr:DUF2341 domain-containing protein [candidate division WOR-3 bacterium]
MNSNSVIVAIVSMLMQVMPAYSDWYDPNWTCRKITIVDNTTNFDTLTNYQIKIGIPYSSNMNSDFSDLRFTDSDEVTLIPYWIEDYIPSDSAIVWVKVPLISALDTTIIYMYYGNPDASSITDFDSTFTKDPDAPYDNGLVLELHLDEGDSSIAYDDSPQANHGALMPNWPSDAPEWQHEDGGQWDGREDVKFSVGSALNFDGNNDYVRIPDADNLTLGANATIEAWVKPDTFKYQRLVTKWGKGSTGDDEYSCDLYMGKYRFVVSGYEGESQVWISASEVPIGKWSHTVGVLSSSEQLLKLYLNGELKASQSTIVTLNRNTPQPIRIGVSEHFGYFFNGVIDEIKIYNRALCDAEIKCHYERRKYTDPEPTVEFGEEECLGYILVEPDQADSALPDSTKEYPLQVINKGKSQDTIDITISGTQPDWTRKLYDSGGVDTLEDHDGDSIPDIEVVSVDTTQIIAKITPPPYALVNEV